MTSFADFFRSSEPTRAKFLSRLFGLFSERVVRTWSAQVEAPYVDLGRPTLAEIGQPRGHTLDFTLRDRSSGRQYIAELKCELEYDNYRYLLLTGSDQLLHHTSEAFRKFLRVAEDPASIGIRLGGVPCSVDGAILIWGAVAPEGRSAVIDRCGFADVLSIEAMVVDLQRWAPEAWSELIQSHRRWTTELFEFLAGPVTPIAASPVVEEGARQ